MTSALYAIAATGESLGIVGDVLSAVSTSSTSDRGMLDVEVLGQGVLARDMRIVWEENGWREAIVAETHVDAGPPARMSAHCIDSITELSKCFIVDRRPGSCTAAAALASALQGTRWSVGSVAQTTAQAINFYHTSVLSAVDEIASLHGLEVWTTIEVENGEIVARSVNMGQRGSDAGVIQQGINMTSLSIDDQTADTFTALYGFGASLETDDGGWTRKLDFSSVNSGRLYVDLDDLVGDGSITAGEADEAREAHGIASEDSYGAVEFTECTDPSELLSLTKAALLDQLHPEPSYSVGVVPGYFENVNAGDTFLVAWDDGNISAQALSVSRDLLDERNTVVTFGNTVKSYGDSYYNPNDIRSTDLKTAGTLLADRAMVTAPGTAYALENSGAVQVRRDGTTGPFFPMISQPTPTSGCSWSIGGGDDELLHFVYATGTGYHEFTLDSSGGIRPYGTALENLFSCSSVSQTIGSVAAGSTKTLTFSATRTGYRAIAISGWYVNGAAQLHPYMLRLNGTNIQCYFRNNTSSATSASATVEVQVLYIKNTA